MSQSASKPSKFSYLTASLLLPVFIPSVVIIGLMLLGTLANPQVAGELFLQVLDGITTHLGWFYLLSVAIFLVFILSIALTSWGDIKLGGDGEEPEYSFFSWFAMLFSAGYGIALLFFGVAEPVIHYASPPEGAPETIDAAKQALQISFFHWGFHIWAIYGLVGLTLAYFSFRHNLPLSMRSTLYPLIGNKIYGPLGHGVDTLAILGTTFGIATTLGLSVLQINTGMNYIWPSIPVSVTTQIITIILITGLATLSVAAGLDKGIKRLSLLNIGLAFTLLLFVLAVGPTLFIIEAFLQNTGSYLSSIVERTFNLQAYVQSDWIGNWTLFIFGWTIAWAPFVGLFIAKISRGRTIRQFVLGVILVPSIFTFFWFSVFGDTALHMIMMQGYNELIDQVLADHSIALFKLFEQLPLTSITSFLAIILIITFFVTSADSGALVVDSLASGGKENTPVWQRVFWAVILGAVASALLLAGGLKALQSASVISALPFAIVMLVAAIGMWRALLFESYLKKSYRRAVKHSKGIAESPKNWRSRLDGLVNYPTKRTVEKFIAHDVVRALSLVAKELKSKDWPAETLFDKDEMRCRIEVIKEDKLDFIYEIKIREYPVPEYALDYLPNRQTDYYRAEVFIKLGGQAYDVFGYDENALINDVLNHFERYLHLLHSSPTNLPQQQEYFAEDAASLEAETTS